MLLAEYRSLKNEKSTKVKPPQLLQYTMGSNRYKNALEQSPAQHSVTSSTMLHQATHPFLQMET